MTPTLARADERSRDPVVRPEADESAMGTSVADKPSEISNESLEIFRSYQSAPFLSLKHESYFQVYEEVFKEYRGKPITLVEVGVLNGGSLFMWRDYFGPAARIIGIDLNPGAKRWQGAGFEIYIGDQSDPKFWDGFFAEVSSIDILIDDGGHTNRQQVVTSAKAIEHINDGGVLVVEDTHTSYFAEFGNPSRQSFVSFAKRMVDAINSRFPGVEAVTSSYGNKVYSVAFYESIVVFRIDSRRCFQNRPTTNSGTTLEAKDLRNAGQTQGVLIKWRDRVASKLRFLKKIPLMARAWRFVFVTSCFILSRGQSRSLTKYFG